MIFETLVKRFEAQQNSKNAEAMSAYLRYQFSFFGVPSPQRRLLYKDVIAAAKKSKSIDWDLLNQAWSHPHRELDYFVCDYLKAMQKHLTYADVPKILTYATSHQWWDTIDYFDRILGNIADTRISELMLELSLSEDFWLRRIAIDHQLGRKDDTDTELLSKIIKNNFGSSEFFINKAIGWALRDYSKTNPDWVRSFVQENKHQMAPLSIREASKYL